MNIPKFDRTKPRGRRAQNDSVPESLYRRAAQLLRESAHTVVLTGAGISTGSGIPDFRTPGTGVWEFVDPLEVASIWSFREDPGRFYGWVRPLARRIQAAAPNPAHIGLATLEKVGLVQQIITQNIDDLHQQAGAQQVLHVHGRAQSITCTACGHQEPGEPFWSRFLESQENFVPTCPHCQGVMKPDVVLYGEEMPLSELMQAQQAALRCDVMLVIGASLEVMPVADLPLLAQRRGARLILCNLGNTLIDHRADVLIREDVTVSIPRLVELCLAET